MRVPGLGMQIYEEHDLPEGFESLPASPFIDCDAWAVHEV